LVLGLENTNWLICEMKVVKWIRLLMHVVFTQD
jgi:hypothetical protein